MPVEEEMAKALLPAVLPLCAWFRACARPLPWRERPTPYRVWVSEVMLQQTAVEAAAPRFTRFVREFPSVRALARAPEERLMKLWEGLGYYSRARRLREAAREVVRRFGGELPGSYEQLLSLPGVGPYTAGAVASIAFHIPVPAVDGNALRVLSRLSCFAGDVTSGGGRARLTSLAAALVPAECPGEFNQALMELGQRVCLPRAVPRCGECPVAGFCRCGGPERAAELPVRPARRPRAVSERTVLVLITDERVPRVLLHRRGEEGLLAGMWELPGAEGWNPPELPGVCASPLIRGFLPLPDARHRFSHVEWRMKGYVGIIPPFSPPPGWALASAEQVGRDVAIPSAFRAYTRMLPVWLAPGDKGE